MIKINPIELFTLIGAGLGYILTILKINEYRKKRVILDADIDKGEEISYDIPLEIKLDNEGLKPTTITGISVLIDNSEEELYNSRSEDLDGEDFSFEEKRIVANDSKSIEVFPKDKLDMDKGEIKITHSKGIKRIKFSTQ